MSIVSDADFADYLGDGLGATDAGMRTQALLASEAFVQNHCKRSFQPAAATATARVYGPRDMVENQRVLRVHDFCDTASLVVSNYGSVVASTSYQLEPLNGVDRTGIAVPYTQIRLLYQPWITYLDKATATITAKWGWTAATTPDAVYEAIKSLGKDFMQYRDTKFGFAETSVGVGQAGRNWMVLNSIAPYRRVEAFGIG